MTTKRSFELKTENPDYFWNRVVLFVTRHGRVLETRQYGLLLLKPLTGLGRPNPDTIDTVRSVTGTILNSIDREKVRRNPTPEEFLDLEGGPKTVYLPELVKVFTCHMRPVAAQLLRVTMATDIEEADDYIRGMLEELVRDYPELAAQSAPLAGEAAKEQRVRQKGGRPRKTELTDEEREAALKYRQHLARGTAKKTAARLVGYDYKTLRRWVELLGE